MAGSDPTVGRPNVNVYDETPGRGTCRSCGAKVDWYETTGGRKVPINANEVPVRSQTMEDGRVSITFLGEQSHFATCPQANQWRRDR
jgi:hypothetical protein